MAQSHAGGPTKTPCAATPPALDPATNQIECQASCRLAAGVQHLKGEGSPQTPGMGGVAPLEERFEATPPLRGPVMALSWDCEMGKKTNYVSTRNMDLNMNAPPWAPVR